MVRVGSSGRAIFKRQFESDEAFVTSLVRYGDFDCIARLFCRSHGRISVFVKNGLKPSKTRGGILQAPCRARVSVHVQPEKGLSQLGEFDVIGYSYALSKDLRSFGWACYLTELVELFLPEHEQAQDIFDELDQVFVWLGEQKCEVSLLRAFELKLLAFCGYLPDLSGAVESDGYAVAALDAVELNEAARKVAYALSIEPLSIGREIDAATLRMVSRIFAMRLKQVAIGPLKSVLFLKSVGV